MNKYINAFAQLGKDLSNYQNNSEISAAVAKAEFENSWFTQEMIHFTLKHWSEILTEENLTSFFNTYKTQNNSNKTVGIVMAGNIPLVGMHDMLMVLLSGNIANVKLSSKDQVLPKLIESLLRKIDTTIADKINFVDRLFKNTDAVIATGSNNTARYFAQYFDKIPHIIRKNRSSVAILSGNETKEQLQKLADDVFLYFGLGCRNVAKVYVPKDYDVTKILDAFEKYSHFLNHAKYMNNYIYHKAIMLMDIQKHLDNDFLLLQENQSLASPMSVLHYEQYADLDLLKENLQENSESLQCICTDIKDFPNSIPLGTSQKPELGTFADNINSFEFLLNLS